MNLSPVEAIKRVNELVTVEMLVQRTKCCTGSSQVFLDSETNHRDPKNLVVSYQYCTLGRHFVPWGPLLKQGRFGAES